MIILLVFNSHQADLSFVVNISSGVPSSPCSLGATHPAERMSAVRAGVRIRMLSNACSIRLLSMVVVLVAEGL